MSEVIDRLHDEHQNIGRVLKALEHQLAVFDKAEQPDYEVLTAIANYFVSFPDRCHHPKEDLVYRKMRVRAPVVAQAVIDMQAEHEEISGLAHHFQEAVQHVLQELEVSRNAFEKVAHHFIWDQRRHMQMEEEHFFPLALKVLTPDDWAEIDEQIREEEDPVFGGVVSQEFAALRDDILKWDEEDGVVE